MTIDLPKTMKAIRFHTYGGPEVLQLEDVPVPRAQAGEVLVRVSAAGVNPGDWQIRSGLAHRKFGIDVPLPSIPGYDVSGIVGAVGPGVTTFQKGDAVYGMTTHGAAYAEYAIADAEHLAFKPVSLDHIQAAGVPMSVLLFRLFGRSLRFFLSPLPQWSCFFRFGLPVSSFSLPIYSFYCLLKSVRERTHHAWFSPKMARKKEEGQVPERPEHAQQECSSQGTKARLQAWQRKATPTRLLKQWRTYKGHEVCHGIEGQLEQPSANECLAFWENQECEELQRWESDQDQQIPVYINAPEHIAVQQTAHACFSVRCCHHEEGGDGWSTERKLPREPGLLAQQGERQKTNAPGHDIRNEKIKEQWVTPQYLRQTPGWGRRLTPAGYVFHGDLLSVMQALLALVSHQMREIADHERREGRPTRERDAFLIHRSRYLANTSDAKSTASNPFYTEDKEECNVK